MKIAVDVSPLSNSHALRGIGSYTKNLKNELEEGSYGAKFIFFEKDIPKNCDLVHFPYFDLFFHTLPITKKQKRVVTIHDVIPLVFPQHFPVGMKGRLNFFLQRRALKNTGAVICDSIASKNDIADKLLFPKEKIHVVYLAPGNNFKRITDKKILNLAQTKFKLPKIFILYVGDVNWNKNISGLLESVKLSKVPLVMVGKALTDSSLLQVKEIDRKIKELGIEKLITKLGHIEEDDLVSVYNLASVTVVPSFYEGFGLPVLESMACGTPVVCSKSSSLPEIGGQSAVYCDPANPADITAKIKDVINGRYKGLSSGLINHASKFNWSKVATETVKVYKSVI